MRLNICNQDCALFLRLYRVELRHSLRFCDHDVSVVGVCGIARLKLVAKEKVCDYCLIGAESLDVALEIEAAFGLATKEIFFCV